MYEQIVAVLAKQLQIDPSSISMDTDIVEVLGAASPDEMEILMEMEQTFSLSIPDEEIVKFRTPGDILAYVKEKTEQA